MKCSITGSLLRSRASSLSDRGAAGEGMMGDVVSIRQWRRDRFDRFMAEKARVEKEYGIIIDPPWIFCRTDEEWVARMEAVQAPIERAKRRAAAIDRIIGVVMLGMVAALGLGILFNFIF